MNKETTKDETVYYKISESELETLREMTMDASYFTTGLDLDDTISDEQLRQAWRVVSSLGLAIKIIQEEFTKVE